MGKILISDYSLSHRKFVWHLNHFDEEFSNQIKKRKKILIVCQNFKYLLEIQSIRRITLFFRFYDFFNIQQPQHFNPLLKVQFFPTGNKPPPTPRKLFGQDPGVLGRVHDRGLSARLSDQEGGANLWLSIFIHASQKWSVFSLPGSCFILKIRFKNFGSL